MLKVIELEVGELRFKPTQSGFIHQRKALSLGVGFTCVKYEENHLSFLIMKKSQNLYRACYTPGTLIQGLLALSHFFLTINP